MAATPAREAASPRTGQQHPPMRWLTVPNAFSVLRLLVFVPLTVWLVLQPDRQLAATCSLAAFGATDWIDGFLARRLGQVSRVGEILDPIADRLGIIVIGLACAIAGWLPWWAIIAIAAGDLALGAIAAFRMRRVREGKVTWLGKIRTALLMVAMPMHLLSYAPELEPEPLRAISWWMLAIGVALHLAAAAGYARRYLSPSPAAPSRTDGYAPTPRAPRTAREPGGAHRAR